jgi:hypothetical protein
MDASSWVAITARCRRFRNMALALVERVGAAAEGLIERADLTRRLWGVVTRRGVGSPRSLSPSNVSDCRLERFDCQSNPPSSSIVSARRGSRPNTISVDERIQPKQGPAGTCERGIRKIVLSARLSWLMRVVRERLSSKVSKGMQLRLKAVESPDAEVALLSVDKVDLRCDDPIDIGTYFVERTMVHFGVLSLPERSPPAKATRGPGSGRFHEWEHDHRSFHPSRRQYSAWLSVAHPGLSGPSGAMRERTHLALAPGGRCASYFFNHCCFACLSDGRSQRGLHF